LNPPNIWLRLSSSSWKAKSAVASRAIAADGITREWKLFSILKYKLDLDDDANTLNSNQQLIRNFAFLIHGFYNRENMLSAIGYLNPIDSQQKFIATRTITTARR